MRTKLGGPKPGPLQPHFFTASKGVLLRTDGAWPPAPVIRALPTRIHSWINLTIHSSSQRALAKPQTLKRVKPLCPVGPQDTRSENSIYKRTSLLNNNSHGDADNKAQPPLRIMVPAVKHRPPKIHNNPDANPSMLLITRQTTVRHKINHAGSRKDSVSFPLSLLRFPIISTFWLPNYIGEKRSLRPTTNVSGHWT